MLRDGSDVLIRPVRHDDAALLAGGFDRLSAQSRRFRFLTAKNFLSPSELRYLTEIDHHDHEALGALDPVDRRGLGIAIYIRAADDPQAAEIAVIIIDQWQGRGLGSELLTRLTDRARAEGIRRFTALVAADNHAVIALLHSLPGHLVLVGHGARRPGIRDRPRSAARGGVASCRPDLRGDWLNGVGYCADMTRPHSTKQPQPNIQNVSGVGACLKSSI